MGLKMLLIHSARWGPSGLLFYALRYTLNEGINIKTYERSLKSQLYLDSQVLPIDNTEQFVSVSQKTVYEIQAGTHPVAIPRGVG